MSEAKKLEFTPEQVQEAAEILSINGQMLSIIHAADPSLNETQILRFCQTYARMVFEAQKKLNALRGILE